VRIVIGRFSSDRCGSSSSNLRRPAVLHSSKRLNNIPKQLQCQAKVSCRGTVA
jgi:hypothetical protein